MSPPAPGSAAAVQLLSLHHNLTSSCFFAWKALQRGLCTLPLLLAKVLCGAEVLSPYPHPFPSQQDAVRRNTSRCISDQYKPSNPHIHPLEQLQNQRHITPNFLHHAADSLQHSLFYGQNLPYAEQTDHCWFRHVGQKQLFPPTHSTAGRRDQTASPSYFPFITSFPFGSLHPHPNIPNPFLPTVVYFPAACRHAS